MRRRNQINNRRERHGSYAGYITNVFLLVQKVISFRVMQVGSNKYEREERLNEPLVNPSHYKTKRFYHNNKVYGEQLDFYRKG